MPILETAMSHFTQDIVRANILSEHAKGVKNLSLKGDILRGAYMMAVGATDAYFCDAYADLVSRTIRAYERMPQANLENKISKLEVSVSTILQGVNGGWRWRNAARKLVERETVLSLEKIKSLFNQFFPDRRKLLTAETLGDWIVHKDAKERMFGISAGKFKTLDGSDAGKKKKTARIKAGKLYAKHFQRRHDCIHNCDRPKEALKPISESNTDKCIHDMDFLVNRCHEALSGEFASYLKRCGFDSATRNAVGAPAL